MILTGGKNGRDRYAIAVRNALHSVLYLPGLKAEVSREI